MIQGELHWPNPKFWNVEAELISRHVTGGGEVIVDPEADLTNEERVQVKLTFTICRVYTWERNLWATCLQLSAYRRAWWALWLLVAVLAIVIWGIVIYAVVSKGSSPRNKPYDNIVITRWYRWLGFEFVNFLKLLWNKLILFNTVNKTKVKG